MYQLLAILLGTFVLHIAVVNIRHSVTRWISKREVARAHGCKAPPHERPWDLFGLWKMWLHTQMVHKNASIPYILARYKKYGETFDFSIFTTRIIMTCEPRNMKHIQVTRFDDYNTAVGIRDDILKPIMPHGLLVVDGEDWKQSRPLYRELLSSTRRIFDVELHERAFQDLRACIPVDGTAVDLQALMHKFGFDFSLEWLTGEPGATLRGGNTPERKLLIESLGYAIHTTAYTAHQPWLTPFTDKKKLRAAVKTLHTAVEKAVDETLEKMADTPAAEEGAQPRSFIEFMARFTKDRVMLRDTTITLLLAGTDPIVSVVSSTIWLLARHPEAYRKLREDVMGVAGSLPPTYDQVRSMKYLRHVFNEALRLFVPLPSNAKLARTDTWLPTGGGPDGQSSVLVRKGDYVLYTPWASHRSVEVFGEDAEDFRPERWEDLRSEKLTGYIPFNLGPRACPGQHFALAQGQWITARLVQTYPTLSTADQRDWVEMMDESFNVKNRNGVIVSFGQRSGL